jgi:hypothetical protein
MSTTETTSSTVAPITYSGFQGRAARARLGESARIILDPEDRSVSVYRAIGNGVPERVWHNRALILSITSANAELGSVEGALREQEELIAQIFSIYGGTRWDGNNHVGIWPKPAAQYDQSPADTLVEAISEAINAEGATKHYWDAGDWLSPAKPDVMAGLRSALREREDGDLEQAIAEYAREEISDADADVILDEDEVVAELTRWAEDDEEICAHLAGRHIEAMDLTWHVAPSDQGQTIETAYATAADDSGLTYRRMTDRSCTPTEEGYRLYEQAEGIDHFEPWNDRVDGPDGEEPEWTEVT